MKRIFICLLTAICLLSGCSLDDDTEIFSRGYKKIVVDASAIKQVYIGDNRECIDFSGLKVNGIKSNGTVEENISGYTITSLSLNVGSVVTDKHVGKQTFTVSYVDGGTTFSDTFSINVRDPKDYMILGYDSSTDQNLFKNKLKEGFSLSDLTSIHFVEFYNTENIPASYNLSNGINIDVKDSGFVKAYLISKEQTDDMIIISGDRVIANTNCTNMFLSNTGPVTGFFYLEKVVLEDLNTSLVTDMHNMFADCQNLKSLDLSGFDTSNVTDMSSMFRLCSSLRFLNVSSFDTSKVTNMENMFNYCSKLAKLNLDNFDTENVTTIASMFRCCHAIQTLDLSNFDTGKVTNMEYLCYECINLEDLNVSGFDTSKVTSMRSMFAFCSSIETLDLRSFTIGSVTDMSTMFVRCSSLTYLDISNHEFNSHRINQGSIIVSSIFGYVNSDIEIYVEADQVYIWEEIVSHFSIGVPDTAFKAKDV